MNGAHDDLLDGIAALALGVVPASEAEILAAHVGTCPQCAAEYADLRAAADAVGSSAEADPRTLDEVARARMRANVMRAVRASAGPPAVAAAPLQTTAQPSILRTARFAYLLATAAAVIAVLGWTTAYSSLHSQADLTARVASLSTQSDAAHERERRLQETLAALAAPGSKHFPVPAGEVVTSGGHVYVAVVVPPLAPGKVYQAWTLHAGAHAMTPSVTFSAATSGEPTIVRLPLDASGLVAVAVSVEPTGGSKAPTSRPTFVRTLS